MKKLVILIISIINVFTCLGLSAKDVSADTFDKLKLNSGKDSKNDRANFTFPVVLVFSENGELEKNIFGKDIFNFESYISGITYSRKVESPNISHIMAVLNEPNETNRPKIVYIDMFDLCPPCKKIKKMFDRNVRVKLSKRYKIIDVNVRDF